MKRPACQAQPSDQETDVETDQHRDADERVAAPQQESPEPQPESLRKRPAGVWHPDDQESNVDTAPTTFPQQQPPVSNVGSLKKRPAASPGAAVPTKEVSERTHAASHIAEVVAAVPTLHQEDEDAALNTLVRDRVKAKKIMELWHVLPEVIRTAYQEAESFPAGATIHVSACCSVSV